MAETIVFKQKAIAKVPPLVLSMFMAELKNLLLTAAHDLDRVIAPVLVDIATGNENYVLLNGQEKAAAPGDMMMADGLGIISSIIHGPDQRTQITSTTTKVLFTVYAPPGIQEPSVARHLHDIESYVRLVSPQACTEVLRVCPI